MPPPKIKLHNKTGKIKTIGNNGPPQISTSSASNENGDRASTSSGLSLLQDSEANRQFELELCWCIQQLESSLKSGKLNEKQIRDIEKNLKILKSKTQSTIKKRQLMNSSFGDYRAKMLEEEKKMSMNAKQIKFKTNPSDSSKSFFVKKSVFLTSGKDFKFDFSLDQATISNENLEAKHLQNLTKPDVISDFQYVQSGNTFKFDFNIDNNSFNSE